MALVKVGPNSWAEPGYEKTVAAKKPRSVAAPQGKPQQPAATPAKKAATAPAWHAKFKQFAKNGNYSIPAAMHAGFSNTEINEMVREGWVDAPANAGVAVRSWSQDDYHEAKRRGLV